MDSIRRIANQLYRSVFYQLEKYNFIEFLLKWNSICQDAKKMLQ